MNKRRRNGQKEGFTYAFICRGEGGIKPVGFCQGGGRGFCGSFSFIKREAVVLCLVNLSFSLLEIHLGVNLELGGNAFTAPK